LEIISTHTWKSFQRALGNPFNGHLEIVTTHTWKSLQRLIGNLYNGSLEILSTAHWKSFQRTLGNLYNGSLEIVSTGTWKSFQRTLGNLNLTTVNLTKLSVAHSKSPLRFFEIWLCSFCDQPLTKISTLVISMCFATGTQSHLYDFSKKWLCPFCDQPLTQISTLRMSIDFTKGTQSHLYEKSVGIKKGKKGNSIPFFPLGENHYHTLLSPILEDDLSS